MRKIKNFLKYIIPEKIINSYRKRFVLNNLKAYFQYDEGLFFKYSNIWYSDSQSKKIGLIVLLYHVIEKGLTMPDMKLGFGRGKLIQLINECTAYKKKYDIQNTQFLHSLGVIKEYKRVHEKYNFELDGELNMKIENLFFKANTTPFVEQLSVTKDSYFKYINAPFNQFSNSRKSIRNFEGSVDLKEIYKAIELAQNTPSPCNRQPVRLHIVDNTEKIIKALEVQKGNRGFGHLVDKLIIVTVDVSIYQSAEERYSPYIDGGMHAMNLLYALHFYKIGACSLNWSKSPNEDLELRNVINIPNSEVVILMIACGKVPNDFKIATSKRNYYSEIISTH